MVYKIKIDYQTGDSEHNYDTSDLLEIEWEDINLAKVNLQRIKEHHEMYNRLHSWEYRKKNYDIIKEYLNKEWFVNVPRLFCISSGNAIDEKDKARVCEGNWEYRPDLQDAELELKFVLDNGNEYRMMAFWIGYFETLRKASIVVDTSDMEITF
jgi:hypothetical protein